MNTVTVTDTADVVAGMLTENTGRHMCDSGDAYGRGWERNAGKDAEVFAASPAAYVTRDFPVLDTFHFLTERLTFDPVMDGKLTAHADTVDPDMGWLGVAESFVMSVTGWDGDTRKSDSDPHTWNTYNGEDLLSQVIQGVTFTAEDADGWDTVYVLVQTHNGADVRGGYSRPRAFRVTGVDMPEYFPYDHADVTVGCRECVWACDLRGGYYTDTEGSPADMTDNHTPWAVSDDGDPVCPACGGHLVAESYPS